MLSMRITPSMNGWDSTPNHSKLLVLGCLAVRVAADVVGIERDPIRWPSGSMAET